MTKPKAKTDSSKAGKGKQPTPSKTKAAKAKPAKAPKKQPPKFLGKHDKAAAPLYSGAPLNCFGRFADVHTRPCSQCPHVDGCASLQQLRMAAGLNLAGDELPAGFTPPSVTRHAGKGNPVDEVAAQAAPPEASSKDLGILEQALRAAAEAYDRSEFGAFVNLVYSAGPLLDRARDLLPDPAKFDTWATLVTGYKVRMRQALQRAARIFPEATHRAVLESIGNGAGGVGKVYTVLTMDDPVAYVTTGKHWVPSRNAYVAVSDMTRSQMVESMAHIAGVTKTREAVSDHDKSQAERKAREGVAKADGTLLLRVLGPIDAIHQSWAAVRARITDISFTPEQVDQLKRYIAEGTEILRDTVNAIEESDKRLQAERDKGVTVQLDLGLNLPGAPQQQEATAPEADQSNDGT